MRVAGQAGINKNTASLVVFKSMQCACVLCVLMVCQYDCTPDSESVLRLEVCGFEHLRHFRIDALSEVLHAHHSLFSSTLLAHCDISFSRLFLAYDNHIRHSLQLVVTNLAPDFLISVINGSSDAYAVEVFSHFGSIIVELL